MSSTIRRRWKQVEREVMRRLGGRRNPVPGRARGDLPDGSTPWLSVEIKEREAVPLWILQAMEQAELSKENGQLPITVIHQHNTQYSEDLVLLRMRDWQDWFGKEESEDG